MPTCRGCGAEIIFARTDRGAMMPLNKEETKVAVIRHNGETRVDRLVVGHVPHHITCPQADDFRRKKTHEENPARGRRRPDGYDTL